MPGGLKLNWGTVTPNSVGQNVITFNSAYTTNAWSIVVTPVSSATNVVLSGYAASITKTGFTLHVANSTAATNTNITSAYYWAIGQ
jgi:hypothetical protein